MKERITSVFPQGKKEGETMIHPLTRQEYIFLDGSWVTYDAPRTYKEYRKSVNEEISSRVQAYIQAMEGMKGGVKLEGGTWSPMSAYNQAIDDLQKLAKEMLL